jgi:hypothetical protein
VRSAALCDDPCRPKRAHLQSNSRWPARRMRRNPAPLQGAARPVGIVSAKQDACSENRPVYPSGREQECLDYMALLTQYNVAGSPGSLDGDGAADHDEPYRFGRRPRASAPYPFNTRQYARLLVFRSRVQDQLSADGQAKPSRCACAAA